MKNDDHILYNQWNFLKQGINSMPKPLNLFINPRDVYMASVGQNIGFEQNGTGSTFMRPVLIIKKFNNQMAWVVPLSTTQKDLDFYHNFTDPFNRPVSAILAQLRLISIKRCNRLLYRLPKKDFSNILQKLIRFLSE